MPSLAKYLQDAFAHHCPYGWVCEAEAGILPTALNRLLGYQSRADVLLCREDDSQRIWIEFEISRADPVANHAKFATAHLFKPWTASDTFISMVSPHVVHGRRNLAANTTTLMRKIGIQSFQTPLFPFLDGPEIKRLNHLPLDDLKGEGLNVRRELKRIFSVVDPVVARDTHRIHFVSNLTDVMWNLHRWHEDLQDERLKVRWGRRTITYFVFDPRTKRFAPSKFCAYTSAPVPGYVTHMSIGQYVTYDEREPRFDGHIARRHLQNHLAMHQETPETKPAIAQEFERWRDVYCDVIQVHPRGPVFLVPPVWFA